MKTKVFELSVCKMDKKLGIFFKKEIYNKLRFTTKDYVKLKIYFKNKSFDYLVKFNRIITLRREVIDSLGIKYKDTIRIEPSKFKPSHRSRFLLHKGQIDLLYLIPEITKKGFPIIVHEFFKEGENWLNVWCYHPRGSCSQVFLRRYLEPKKFGKLLGLLQAEGTKNNFKVLEFGNNSVFEHKDFKEYLAYIGVDTDNIIITLTCGKLVKNVEQEIKRFKRFTGSKVNHSYTSNRRDGEKDFMPLLGA